MKRESMNGSAAAPLMGNQPIGFTDTPRQWAQINPDGSVHIDWSMVEIMAKKIATTPMQNWTVPEATAYILWHVHTAGSTAAAGKAPKAEEELQG